MTDSDGSSTDAVQELVYAVSHDLRAPLRAVTGFVGILSRRYRDELEPAAAELLDLAHTGATQMQVMLDGLLVYSRVMTHGRPLTACGLEGCLDRAVEAQADALAAADGRIQRTSTLPPVQGDAAQLTELFSRLLANAIYFADKDVPLIDIDSEVVDGWVTINVVDHGPGIEPALVPRALLLFQRLHHAEKGYTGVGMGLPIAARIVERHGGALALRPAAGHRGLHVEIRLPLIG